MSHASLEFAITQAQLPDVDDFDSFTAWCQKQENCCVAVACAAAHMLRLLQAAGDCPSLRETLKSAAECELQIPAPLRILLDGLRCHGPGH